VARRPEASPRAFSHVSSEIWALPRPGSRPVPELRRPSRPPSRLHRVAPADAYTLSIPETSRVGCTCENALSSDSSSPSGRFGGGARGPSGAPGSVIGSSTISRTNPVGAWVASLSPCGLRVVWQTVARTTAQPAGRWRVGVFLAPCRTSGGCGSRLLGNAHRVREPRPPTPRGDIDSLHASSTSRTVPA
jgi:hypothetical protein